MGTKGEILVADEVWVAVALLHREHPERASFSAGEIRERLRSEGAHPKLRPGVQVHISLHNVANLPPNSAQYRMLYRLPDGSYRLFRPGDEHDPRRQGKSKPHAADLPGHYHELLTWYESVYCAKAADPNEEDPVLAMRGVGKELWEGIDADAYIAELRAGWDDETCSREGSDGRQHHGASGLGERVWSRITAHAGEEFFTKTGKRFTYTLEGDTGIWFYRRIEKRLWRGDVNKAIKRCPPNNTTELKDCFDPAYLFGLLIDPRIRGGDW